MEIAFGSIDFILLAWIKSVVVSRDHKINHPAGTQWNWKEE